MNRQNEPEWPIRDDDRASRGQRGPAPVAGSRISPVWIALGALGLLVIGLLVFAATRDADQDKLAGASNSGQAVGDPARNCSSKATYGLIKRELFRRAAQVRGSDQADFDRLAAIAVLRMENPVMESEDDTNNAVNCSGSLSIDLPPDVAVVGGRRSLTGDVDYTVQPATDGSGNVVLLRSADAIVTALATAARSTPAPSADAAVPPGNLVEVSPENAAAAPPPPPSVDVRPPLATQPPPAARPSFNCGAARTRGEVAVCGDAGLATLDRRMASQFNRAMSNADSEQRALLQRTRSSFLAYRDRCNSNGCMADAYRGRIREIDDIMKGRWHR